MSLVHYTIMYKNKLNIMIFIHWMKLCGCQVDILYTSNNNFNFMFWLGNLIAIKKNADYQSVFCRNAVLSTFHLNCI